VRGLPDPDWYLDEVVVPAARIVGPARSWQAEWTHRARVPAGPVGRAAAEHGFVLTRAQLRKLGVADAEVRRLIARRTWWSPRFGIVSVVGRSEDPRAAAALSAAAAALARADSVVSHRSAAVLHGLPVLAVRQRPELTCRDASAGRRDQVHVRRAALAAAEIVEWFGTPVTSVARTIVDIARLAVPEGLIAADAALHERLVTPAELLDATSRCARQPGARSARTVVALASPLAESPLESLARLCVVEAGLPEPELQAWITDPSDGWRCRVDLLWPEQRVVLEADGRIKYRGDELWREKLRQERLERLGYRVIRVLWRDVMYRPTETIARIRRALSATWPTS